jgi:geranylgeranyl pyrophosphate synthase
MFFLAEINNYRVTVDNAILTELHQRNDSPFFTPLSNALKAGKRLRPILLLLAFESVDGGGLRQDPLTLLQDTNRGGDAMAERKRRKKRKKNSKLFSSYKKA